MWHEISTPPEKGKWVVGLYTDGSGAVVFMALGDGTYWGADGGCIPALNYFEKYAYLPDDFEAWVQANNPET